MDIAEILELNERAKEDGKNFPRTRQLFGRIQSEVGRHFIGIVGPRGVGKTVMLKQLALAQPNSFYLSADAAPGADIFQTARILSEQYKVSILCGRRQNTTGLPVDE